jgi:hypothetical protein
MPCCPVCKSYEMSKPTIFLKNTCKYIILCFPDNASGHIPKTFTIHKSEELSEYSLVSVVAKEKDEFVNLSKRGHSWYRFGSQLATKVPLHDVQQAGALVAIYERLE